MTQAERDELNHLRECWRRMPSEVPRLIELERMDAARAERERYGVVINDELWDIANPGSGNAPK